PGKYAVFQSFGEAPPSTPMNWGALKDGLKPATIPGDTWDVIFANFTAMVGSTLGQYQAALAAAATHLGVLGVTALSYYKLYAFLLQYADAPLPRATLVGVQDAAAPEPGFPLVFGRVFHQPISGRRRLGPLGRGWTHDWDGEAITDAKTGNVTIRRGAAYRFFQKVGNAYQGLPGEYGTLTLVNNSYYQLREADGTLQVFRTDGKLDYVEDTHGNSVKLGYTGNLLTTLTHSGGSVFT